MNTKFSSTNQSSHAELQHPNPQDCLIPMAADQALAACVSMRVALQKLRDRLISCYQCSAFDDCHLHEHFNLLVDQAIEEINEDWGW
jgi:hypothetical protein